MLEKFTEKERENFYRLSIGSSICFLLAGMYFFIPRLMNDIDTLKQPITKSENLGILLHLSDPLKTNNLEKTQQHIYSIKKRLIFIFCTMIICTLIIVFYIHRLTKI